MSEIRPNYDETLGFLRAFHPTSWWVLSAIPVEGEPGQKKVLTETFEPGDEDGARKWLAEMGREHNLYFHPAITKDPMNKRVRRENVDRVSWLHVDVDPRAGEDIQAERERIVKALTDPPKGVPKPTAIIFSGGGYQAYWMLREPIEIHGILDKAKDAARYNLQIERVFGADSCHSIDHLMRLPGTINRPDERKRRKGREPRLAEIVEWADDRVYDLDEFVKAQEVQQDRDRSGFTGHRPIVEVSGNIPKLTDVDELGDKVSDLVKATIVQGEHPDEPERHSSRSETLWWVVCELTRQGVEPDTIYSVITDPDFGIAQSVLDKGNQAHSYALKQITDAAEKAIDPNLYQMNQRYAAVRNYGGFSIVYEEWEDGLDRFVLKRFRTSDLRGYYMNRMVEVGEDEKGNKKYKPLADWWLSHPNRRQYEGIVFLPGRDAREGYYNLWQGFAVAALPGDGHQKFLDHLRDNVCRGDEERFEYLLGWMARTVQFPGEPGHVAVVMRGKRGTGKSVTAKVLGHLFGRHYMMVTNPRHLVGNFNAHLRDVVVLFGDEAFYAGDKKHESVLKTLITEDTMVHEQKGIDATIGVNCIHLMMASNDDWVVPAGFDERRFFVLDVGDEHAQDSNYFRDIFHDLEEDGGYESLLHYLQTYDLSNFEVRTVPKTDALRDQIIRSMDPEFDWWFQKLIRGTVLESDGDWEREVWKVELYMDYIESLRLAGRNKRSTETAFGAFMKRVLPEYGERRSRETLTLELPGGREKSYDRVRYIKLPDLETARAHYDRHFGGPFNWDELAATEEEPEDPSMFPPTDEEPF